MGKGGDAGGSYHLALLPYMGSGIRKDLQRAARLFKRTVEQAVSDETKRFAGLAALNLGTLLADGSLGSPSPTKAKKWWLKAAAHEALLPEQARASLRQLRQSGR